MEEEVRICDCCERCFDEFEDEIEDYSYKPNLSFTETRNDTSA